MHGVSKSRQREETFEKLMQAALEEFAVNGYDGTSVDNICQAAGFSKGAFYVHFHRKEDIFFSLIERKIEIQQETFRASCTWEGDLRHCIRNIFGAIVGSAVEEPYWAPLFLEFYAHAARNGEVRSRVAGMFQKWRSFLSEMIVQGQEAGVIKKDMDEKVFATLVIALVDGLITQAKVDPGCINIVRAGEEFTAFLYPYLTNNRQEEM